MGAGLLHVYKVKTCAVCTCGVISHTKRGRPDGSVDIKPIER